MCLYIWYKSDLILIGLMSRWTRKPLSLYQDQCRAPLDKLFHGVLCWLSLRSYHLMAAFEDRRLQIFWKINLVYTVRIQVHNLDCKILTVNTQVITDFVTFQCIRPDFALISVWNKHVVIKTILCFRQNNFNCGLISMY